MSRTRTVIQDEELCQELLQLLALLKEKPPQMLQPVALLDS